MDPIARSQAERTSQHPYIAGREPLLITTRSGGHTWATKTGEWPRNCHVFRIRLGVELICYALARHNGLRVPESRILLLEGTPMWGVEIRDGRKALGKDNCELPVELRQQLDRTFKENPDETIAYLRAVFLDVMLLNNDRTVSNVLHAPAGELFELSYFDHEQGLGWKNDIHVFGRNRIRSPDEEYHDLAPHLLLETKYHWGATNSASATRQAVFDAFTLEPDLLDELRDLVVGELQWLSPFQYEAMKCGLAAWWAYLRAKPYADLDARIFASAG